jgi:hypothetical protein
VGVNGTYTSNGDDYMTRTDQLIRTIGGLCLFGGALVFPFIIVNSIENKFIKLMTYGILTGTSLYSLGMICDTCNELKESKNIFK